MQLTSVLGVCCLFLAASPSPSPSPAGSTLYVPQGVVPLWDRDRGNGIRDLEFDVDEPYPAPRFIASLTETLEGMGWTVPSSDPLNPGLGPAFVARNWARWSEAEGLASPRPQALRDWQCVWTKPDGAVVRYVLRYTRASSQDAWSQLRVIAVYWPPEVARGARQRMGVRPSP